MTRIVRKHSTLAARLFPRLMLATLVAGVLLLAVTAVQAATPEQACKSGKNKTAGKYAACRENAEAKLAAGGDPSKYTAAIDKCESKFSTAWDKLEAKALAASASCPADDTVIKGKTDAYTDTVAALVAGGTRFTDNGDGTVIDHQTGLQWEKKVAGSFCLHCMNFTYSWSNGGMNADGTAFTSFLGQLTAACTSGDGNTITGGFAGHCDWRLPTIAELQTILDATQGNCGGGSGPCIDPIFGPTIAGDYWSATSDAPGVAWGVGFSLGFVGTGSKGGGGYVRAVRTGS